MWHKKFALSLALAVSGMVLLLGNAKALNMNEREDVQTISRMVEFGTLAVALVIGVFIWRFSKLDSKKKKRRSNELKAKE